MLEASSRYPPLGAQGTLWKKRRNHERQRGRKHPGEPGPWNQINKTHEGSQRLQQWSRSLSGSRLDPLHIGYSCWLSVLKGLLILGVWYFLLFCLLFGPLISYWVSSSCLDLRVCAWCCILLCSVKLMSQRSLLFSGKRGRVKGEWIWGRGKVSWELGEEKGSSGWDVLYERRVNKK